MLTDQRTHAREFGNLLAVQDNWPKYVISSDEFAGGSDEGIIHLHIRDFLIKREF